MNGDISSFIQARLDEIEQRVRNDIEWWFSDEVLIEIRDASGGLLAGGDVYIRPFIDPSTILADIESKRRILEDCSRAVDTARKLHGDDQEKWSPWSRQAWRTFQNLALPFATHPEYREEWAP